MRVHKGLPHLGIWKGMGSALGDLFERGVVKADKVRDGESCRGVGAATIVGKLDLDGIGRKNLDNCSHLAAHQTVLGPIP